MPTTKTRAGSARSTTSSRRGDATARRPSPKPFTVDHYRRYARLSVLDDGENFDPEDFQLELVEDLFAGYAQNWWILPEGSGKTTFLGHIGLYYGDYTESAMIPIAASSREQAEILYRQAEGFVLRTPGLRDRFKCQEGYRRIKCLRTGGRLQVYAADDRTGDGIIPGGIALLDELHRHRDLRLYRVWVGKLSKRGAQAVAISTAGEPDTEFEQARERIRNDADDVRTDGCHVRAVLEDTVLHDFRVPDRAQADDMEIVAQANPRRAVTAKMLRRKHDSPTMTNEHWLRFVCNIATRPTTAAITEAEWDAAATDERIPAGEPVDVGLDIAWKWDTTAFVPLWMPEFEKRLFGDPHILTPPRDGTMLDPYELERAFDEINDRNPVQTVVMDREKGEQFATWLENERGVTVVERGRSNLPAAEDYERFMEALRGGKGEDQDAGEPWIRHTGHREFRQHVMNAVTRLLPSDKRRFERPQASRRDVREQDRRVIDALDAATMVHTVAAAGLTNAEPMIGWVGR